MKQKNTKKEAAAPRTAASEPSAAPAVAPTPAKFSAEQLWMELQEHNVYFDDLVDMIPSRLYISKANPDVQPISSSKYYKGQSKDSKESRRALSKQAKRMKLDPTLKETTTQLKQRLEMEEVKQTREAGAPAVSHSNNKKGKKYSTGGLSLPGRPSLPRQVTEREHDDHEENNKDGDGSDDVVTTKISNKKTNHKKDKDNNHVVSESNDNVTAVPAAATFSSSSSRIEELRAKIHAKLAEKRGQRPSDPATISRIAARRAERKKRKDLGGKGDKKDTGKKNKKSAISHAEDKTGPSSYTMSRQDHDDPAADLAHVDFGRLAGLNSPSLSNYTETNKALKNLSKTKNLEKMLADAEAKRQRLKELQQSSAEEDRQKAKNIQWGDAIKEASGERVKDDPNKIKKLLKRKATSKAKSAKAWKSRMEQTQQKMQERQKIRNHNLQQRKQGGAAGANLSKKRIVTEGGETKVGDKKPRLNRPGFEGRKQEFLNPAKKKSQ